MDMEMEMDIPTVRVWRWGQQVIVFGIGIRMRREFQYSARTSGACIRFDIGLLTELGSELRGIHV